MKQTWTWMNDSVTLFVVLIRALHGACLVKIFAQTRSGIKGFSYRKKRKQRFDPFLVLPRGRSGWHSASKQRAVFVKDSVTQCWATSAVSLSACEEMKKQTSLGVCKSSQYFSPLQRNVSLIQCRHRFAWTKMLWALCMHMHMWALSLVFSCFDAVWPSWLVLLQWIFVQNKLRLACLRKGEVGLRFLGSTLVQSTVSA